MALKGLHGPGPGAVEKDLHLGARRHVHFAPDIADGGDGGHEQVHLGLGPGVVESGLRLGVGRHHDAALGPGQLLPDFLGHKRTVRMQKLDRIQKNLRSNGANLLF